MKLEPLSKVQVRELLLLKPRVFSTKYGISRNEVYLLKQRYQRRIDTMERLPNQEKTPEQIEELEQIKELLKDFKAHGIDIDEANADSVTGFRVWQMGSVDADGNPQITTLRGIELTPQRQLHEADIIRQAPPVIIRPAKVSRAKSKDKKAIIVPDLQGGYRRHGELLEPIHDENVVDVGLQIIRDTEPDLIVLNGDNLDFPDMSHYLADSEHFQAVMQATVDRVYVILAQMRANAPDANIIWLEGNHEERLSKNIIKHNMPLLGIKRPGTQEAYRWLSIANLMNLESLGITYVSGYPANRYLINDRLQVVHGDKVRSKDSTAVKYVKEEPDVSTIYGHVHRIEHHRRTLARSGRSIVAMSFGTWARIDGAVPSYGNAVDDEGHVVRRFEDWQNGMGLIEYQEGDKPWRGETIHIDHSEGYETRFNGKLYRPLGN